jgi:hypothetical protein
MPSPLDLLFAPAEVAGHTDVVGFPRSVVQVDRTVDFNEPTARASDARWEHIQRMAETSRPMSEAELRDLSPADIAWIWGMKTHAVEPELNRDEDAAIAARRESALKAQGHLPEDLRYAEPEDGSAPMTPRNVPQAMSQADHAEWMRRYQAGSHFTEQGEAQHDYRRKVDMLDDAKLGMHVLLPTSVQTHVDAANEISGQLEARRRKILEKLGQDPTPSPLSPWAADPRMY